MIKTYDEALKTLNDVRTYLAINRADDCVQELDKVARYFINEKHKESPTLEQCIKEWENKGFIVKNDKDYIFLDYGEYGIGLFIDKREMKYHIFYGYISLELNKLLTKTLKSLEVKNGKEI